VRLLLRHPGVTLGAVTSRTFAGAPVWKSHPALQGQTDLAFSETVEPADYDALIVAAEHGRSAQVLPRLLADGYDGAIVDLSADFRFTDSALYDTWFGYTHPAPELLEQFAYGLPEVNAPYPSGSKWVANPGCFATGVAIALWPLSEHAPELSASVTALTGASGSGAQPSATTHYPSRDGNVRAYKVLRHQHLPEVEQVVGTDATIAFVPASGPWTRGIWGTAHIDLPGDVTEQKIGAWFTDAYGHAPLVRLTPGCLPELRHTVGTAFCDLGWVMQDDHLVVGGGGAGGARPAGAAGGGVGGGAGGGGGGGWVGGGGGRR
jgi:LysW-gamma-L-alpha-aminoadipyl-6-phosphate/LysW-L-glutamyl-5-phosphate reductase